MDRNIKFKTIKIAATSLALAGFIFLLAPFEANAQWRRGNDRRSERGESRNIIRIAEAQGYSDGLRQGANAIRGRKRHNPYGEGKYKKGTNGYQSRFGTKSAYKMYYRQSFVRGYNDAFYRDTRRVIRPSRRGF